MNRPRNMRPILTDGYFDGSASGFSRLRLRPSRKGPVYRAGQAIAVIGKPSRLRPVWMDDFGALRIGRTGDMVQMLADIGVSDRAF